MVENSAGPDPEENARATPAESEQDSMTFSRCMGCAHVDEIDRAAGTLLCEKHNMRCDAESDAIPDDCPQFEPRPAS